MPNFWNTSIPLRADDIIARVLVKFYVLITNNHTAYQKKKFRPTLVDIACWMNNVDGIVIVENDCLFSVTVRVIYKMCHDLGAFTTTWKNTRTMNTSDES